MAVVLAMQILGGDPAAAYLTVLFSLGYAIGLTRPGRTLSRPLWLWWPGIVLVILSWNWVGPTLASWVHGAGARLSQAILLTAWVIGVVWHAATRPPAQRPRHSAMIVGLAGSAILAIALTAAQALPVLDHIGKSVRWAGAGTRLLYDSSVLPYRAVEWVWPNVFGTFGAGNRYWMSLLPPVGAQRPWPLSLYMGALPLVLAIGAAGFRDRSPWCAWVTAVALLSITASLGEFTGRAAWLNQGATSTAGDDSFYGLLTTIVPGLRLFRFPFKLLVFANLALSALGGIGWDWAASGVTRRRVIVIGIGLLTITALTLTACLSLKGWLAATMAGSRQSVSSVFGPIDAQGAVAELIRSLGHGALAIGLSLALVISLARWPRRGGLAAMVLLTVDLTVANSRLVYTIPQTDFERLPAVVEAIRAAESNEPSPGPFRVHRMQSWVPIGWSETSDRGRLRELVDWEIDTIQPGFGLLYGVNYVLTEESETTRADYSRFFQPSLRAVDDRSAAALRAERGQQVLYHPRNAFDLWGCRYFILPSSPGDWRSPERSYASFIDETEMIYPDSTAMEGPAQRQDRERWLMNKDVQVRRNKAAFPRAWAVHSARLLPQLDHLSSSTRDALIARIAFRYRPTGDDSFLPPPDLKSMAYIETDDPNRLAAYLPGTTADRSESVTVRYDSPVEVEIEVRLAQPGLVVLADMFDSGWRLKIDGRPAPILRANLLMRAAAVTAGTHTLVYTYEPASVWIGVLISLAALVVLLGLRLWAGRYPVSWAGLDRDNKSS
jgi:hypothetical protein